MNYQKNLEKLGLILPDAKAPVGNYVATKISGKMLFISGQISVDENAQLIKGKVGKDLDVDSGYNAAKRCALSIISQIMKACDNDLTKISLLLTHNSNAFASSIILKARRRELEAARSFLHWFAMIFNRYGRGRNICWEPISSRGRAAASRARRRTT